MGIACRVKAEIKRLMDSDPLLKNYFKDYLPLGSKKYADRAVKIFKDIGNKYEMEICQKIFL